MRIVTLRGGHTEVEVSPSEAIAEIERIMNELGGAERSVALVEEPGQPAERVPLQEIPTRHPDSVVWVIPQFVGG